MLDGDILSVKELSDVLGISRSTIYRLVKKNKLTAVKDKEKLIIVRDDKFISFVSGVFSKRRFASEKAYYPDELSNYHNWHELIDYFSWLFKVCYTHRTEIQSKTFNIRVIFENYLSTYDVNLKKLRTEFRSKVANKTLILDDLKRGWYNELAFIYPLKKATLGISFREITTNRRESSIRFSFPSWKIIESYYAWYFYLRAITLFKNSNFRLEEHKSTLTCFKNNVLDSLKKTIWGFPFDIEYKPGSRFFVAHTLAAHLPYLKFGYCKYPRAPYSSPKEIVREIHSKFKKKSQRFPNPIHYTIFDFLLEFRIWANYLDIDNLLNLWGGGFKAFLDQNLSLFLFLIGGITELIYIAVFGEEDYLEELQKIYDLFALNNEEIKDTFIYSPLYQRMRIYKFRELISHEIEIESVINENEIDRKLETRN